uniref:Uncharacterized protein n=1 Tax=Leishmania guyanensis TaxID=5670 RepID=A0A1E1IU28_LEIGU|nr:hypothetical protein, conserved [Leishmania guyanensis]
MSASLPADERPTMLPSLPAQAASPTAAAPAEVAAASRSGTSITSAERDSPPSERCAMSFEEFREFYVASRRSNYVSSQGNTAGSLVRRNDGGVPTHDTGDADALTGKAPGQLHVVGALRRRIVGTDDDSARPAQTAAPAVTPPPVVHAPPAPRGRLARGARAVGGWMSWLANQAMHNRTHLLQLLLIFFVLYVHVKLSSAHLLGLIVLYVVVKGMQVLIRNFQITHEAGTIGAPSLLGRFFKPEGHVGPVSKLRKIGYVVTKCMEAFLLSFFPTYSLEHLERELRADGIVR